MKKRICLSVVFLCISLCACQSTVVENEAAVQETTAFIEAYENIFREEDAKRTALIYLDEDNIPELLLLKNGEYRLYTFDGSEVRAIDMPGAEIRANAYGRGMTARMTQKYFTGLSTFLTRVLRVSTVALPGRGRIIILSIRTGSLWLNLR